MALVAYENSDSSDYEDEENDAAPVILLDKKPENKQIPGPSAQTSVITNGETESQENGPSLFNFLPQPKNKKPQVIEEDDEFLHKKADVNAVKPKAKITVPSLSDFKDVEDNIPNVKPRSTQAKKSGLLSMLPQPRNGFLSSTKSLIPNVLTKKPAPVKKAPLPTPAKKAKVDSAPLINDYSDESDDEVQNDFFSIHKTVELPEHVDIPLEIEQNAKAQESKPRGIEAFFKKEEVVEHVELQADYEGMESMEQEPGSSYSSYAETASASSNDMELDDEAIMKLVGARGKRKREEIQIVDVNQKEVLANAREMLMKGLMDDTTKRVSASKKKGNEPTTQQRRKHQITYLAYQAKANEAELQNQWANNRMSKRQTQAKYGF